MDLNEEPRELEQKIEQATRIASRINDQTMVERLRAWIEDLKQHTGPGNLGTERTPWRPRLGVLVSSGVRDQRARSTVIDCLSIGRSEVCLNVSIFRSDSDPASVHPAGKHVRVGAPF